MNDTIEWPILEKLTEKEEQIIRLQAAKDKLTPILDMIIASTLDNNNKGEENFIPNCLLTADQCDDIFWASQTLNDIKCELDANVQQLPNCNVIVNTVSLDHRSASCKTVLIDEGLIGELLETYEQMSTIIERLCDEVTVQSISSKSTQCIPSVCSRKSSSRKSVCLCEEDVQTDEPSVFIKIQCFSDSCDTEKGEQLTLTPQHCDDHYHIQVGGEPVTFKVNQNAVEEGAVYCICTGNEGDDDIKIVIKQCPECQSTVIGSSTRMSGDSNESITCLCEAPSVSVCDVCSGTTIRSRCDRSSTIHLRDCHGLALGTITIRISATDCKCQTSTSTKSCCCGASKIDVLLDRDNVGRSKVKLKPCKPRIKCSPHVQKKTSCKKCVPICRKRVCSSLEFDVRDVHTRLRDQDIRHCNPKVAVELKNLGVNKLLRASRPAKCCRRAILNERQRVALPYCVSLRSLPLMCQDVEVIKQSVDMSMRKMKKCKDVRRMSRDTLAYYVNLGKDDYKPCRNFPWVVPMYDVIVEGTSTETITKQYKSVDVFKEDTSEHSPISHFKKKFPIWKSLSEFCVPWQFARVVKVKKRTRRFKLRFKHLSELIFIKKIKSNVISSPKKHKSTNSSGSQNHGQSSSWRSCVSETNLQKLNNKVDFEFSCSANDVFLSRQISATNILHAGDACTTPFEKILDRCLENTPSGSYSLFARCKALSDTQFNRKHCLSHRHSKVSFSASYIKRGKVFERKERNLQKSTLTEQPHIANNKIDSKTKLEYYVALVDGDLVWSEALPQKPINYETYYNHSQDKRSTSKIFQTFSEEEIVPVQAENPRERRMTEALQGESSRERRISERSISDHDISAFHPQMNDQELSANNFFQESFHSRENLKLTPSIEGPEVQDDWWCPLLVSETSLPQLREEVQKVQVVKEEGVKEHKEEDKIKEVKSITVYQAKPKPSKSKCTSKAYCTKRGCLKCKEKMCASKKHKVSDQKSCKGCGGIRIDIKKTDGSVIRLDGAMPACNNDLCELYKNKKWKGSWTWSKPKPTKSNQQFRITGKDNVEIYIDKQKVFVGKTDSKAGGSKKKDTKERKEKENRKKDKKKRREEERKDKTETKEADDRKRGKKVQLDESNLELERNEREEDKEKKKRAESLEKSKGGRKR